MIDGTLAALLMISGGGILAVLLAMIRPSEHIKKSASPCCANCYFCQDRRICIYAVLAVTAGAAAVPKDDLEMDEIVCPHWRESR